MGLYIKDICIYIYISLSLSLSLYTYIYIHIYIHNVEGYWILLGYIGILQGRHRVIIGTVEGLKNLGLRAFRASGSGSGLGVRV